MYLCGVWNKSSTINIHAIFATSPNFTLNVTLPSSYAKADIDTDADYDLLVTKSFSMVMRCRDTILWLMMVTVISFRRKEMMRMKMMNIMEIKIKIAVGV